MNRERNIPLLATPLTHKAVITQRLWLVTMLAATTIAVVTLSLLIMTVVNNCFGFVLLQDTIPIAQLDPNAQSLDDIPRADKIALINERIPAGIVRRLEREEPLSNRSRDSIHAIIEEYVIQPTIVESWSLTESLFHREDINLYRTRGERVEFRAWLHPRILFAPQSSNPQKSGVRTAVLGSLWMIAISLVLAFPIGVATAVYLEEYAKNNKFNQIVQINIYNLAGIPSIIYGLLGLVVFVRILEPITSGRIFTLSTDLTLNGRTIISAGATLGLLILPIIIISTQEAIKAVPQSLRDSSYAVGATQWQTIWHHVLPNCIDRIITGTILAVSRAVGETAPLVVVGASTFITVNPTGPFSKFTTLPIQIYQWSSRPQPEFRKIAAAAIIVLLILLLSMNTLAIVLRNHYSKKRRLML